MITIKKINNQIVRPLKINQEGGNKPIKGYDLFPELYANILICSKKKTGKTNVIAKIIKECAVPKLTTVIMFCSTIHKDRSHIEIKKFCLKSNIPYVGYTSLKEDGVDMLETFIKSLENEDSGSEDELENEEEKRDLVFFSESDDETKIEEKHVKKSKYQYPKYIIIFDDLSNELKTKSIDFLLKRNRHFLCKTIVSTQYVHDINPSAWKQMDYVLIFKGQPIEKLEKIHKEADLSIELEKFIKIYHHATQKPYSFLYIDVRLEKLRQNFNVLYNIN